MSKKLEKKINLGILIFRIISLLIIIVCLIVLYNWNKENNKNQELATDLQKNSVTESFIPINPTNTTEKDSTPQLKIATIDFETLLKQNEDTVGYIMIDNTNISFPIVKSKDNNFYLKHNFNKEYNSAGWIYSDYRNDFENLDQNTIIYGHNRRNGTMFSNLKNYLNESWYNDPNRKNFYFSTINTEYIAEIYSIYKIHQNNIVLYNNFESEERYNDFIKNTKDLSIKDFNTQITTQDKILTLSTCDNNTKYRIIIHAKLIPISY